MVNKINSDTSNATITHLTVNTELQAQQEGQHPLTGQRATNFRLLANQ